jgi:hypothetical protein
MSASPNRACAAVRARRPPGPHLDSPATCFGYALRLTFVTAGDTLTEAFEAQAVPGIDWSIEVQTPRAPRPERVSAAAFTIRVHDPQAARHPPRRVGAAELIVPPARLQGTLAASPGPALCASQKRAGTLHEIE